MNKTYYFHPDKNVLRQGFLMEDANKNIVYEGKMIKKPIIGTGIAEFVNHVSGETTEHKVGQVSVITKETSFGFIGVFDRKASFKFDGENIWEYINNAGLEIAVGEGGSMFTASYNIFEQGNLIATLTMTSPGGGPAVLPGAYFEVSVEDENLDAAFLTAFAIAKTEQGMQ